MGLYLRRRGGGGGHWGAYIWNVNSVKYLVGVHLGAILTGFYGILQYVNM